MVGDVFYFIAESWVIEFKAGRSCVVIPSKTCRPIKEQVTLQELMEAYCEYKRKGLDSIEIVNK